MEPCAAGCPRFTLRHNAIYFPFVSSDESFFNRGDLNEDESLFILADAAVVVSNELDPLSQIFTESKPNGLNVLLQSDGQQLNQGRLGFL